MILFFSNVEKHFIKYNCTSNIRKKNSSAMRSSMVSRVSSDWLYCRAASSAICVRIERVAVNQEEPLTRY